MLSRLLLLPLSGLQHTLRLPSGPASTTLHRHASLPALACRGQEIHLIVFGMSLETIFTKITVAPSASAPLPLHFLLTSSELVRCFDQLKTEARVNQSFH